MKKYGLTLHPDKTRIIEFGRFAEENRRQRGEGKPGTFDFLGFTHSCARTKKTGKFYVRRQTIKKRLRAKLKETGERLRKRMHDPVKEVGVWLRSVVQGHLNYYAVPGNSHSTGAFVREVEKIWKGTLCRRSQKAFMTWSHFERICRPWIPRARILHPYPLERFLARHPT